MNVILKKLLIINLQGLFSLFYGEQASKRLYKIKKWFSQLFAFFMKPTCIQVLIKKQCLKLE